MSAQSNGRKYLPVVLVLALVAISWAVMTMWHDDWAPEGANFNEPNETPNVNPVGAGSNPEGSAAVIDDGIVQHADESEIIGAGSSGNPDQSAGRTLDPDEVISPETGRVDNETGTVQASDDADASTTQSGG